MDGLVDGRSMRGVTFPGDSTVELGWHEIPTPGPGEVLLRTGASGICGSDLSNAYLQRRDRGPRTYTGCIGGHEFAGTVAGLGPGVHAVAEGDLVLVYHVAGCGQCAVCREGYMIHCGSPRRRAYGNQRDGGHAPFVLVDAGTCVPAPDGFTVVDAALMGCGFGTAYEGLRRVGVSGADEVLVVGLGPLGLATAMVARALGARRIVGAEVEESRRRWAKGLPFVDEVVEPGEVATRDQEEAMEAGFQVSVDASGSPAGRLLAVRALRAWGRCALLGEGGEVTLDVSNDLLHKEITVSGSWVTSVGNMARCAHLLADHELHPQAVVEHVLPLADADRAYALAAGRGTGKVCFRFDA